MIAYTVFAKRHGLIIFAFSDDLCFVSVTISVLNPAYPFHENSVSFVSCHCFTCAAAFGLLGGDGGCAIGGDGGL